jgi:hypothetical protein
MYPPSAPLAAVLLLCTANVGQQPVPVRIQKQTGPRTWGEVRWRAHLRSTARKLAKGATGTVFVQLPLPHGRRPAPALRVRVAEVVPDFVRAGWGLGIVPTEHFVASGAARQGRFVVERVPIGLSLEIEVWPADDSRPPAKRAVAGPVVRGQRVAVELAPADPYPELTGRLLSGVDVPLRAAAVAIELRTRSAVRYEQVRTDGAGRFRFRVRVPRRAGESLWLTLVPGPLVRSGGRIYTIDLPPGRRWVQKSIAWPALASVPLGDLVLARRTGR